jgi:hypothetical protein
MDYSVSGISGISPCDARPLNRNSFAELALLESTKERKLRKDVMEHYGGNVGKVLSRKNNCRFYTISFFDIIKYETIYKLYATRIGNFLRFFY